MNNPGILDRDVIFQKNYNAEGEERNEFSEPTDDWRDEFDTKAKVVWPGSREFRGERKQYEESTAQFTIRYRPGINSSEYRIVLIEPFETGDIEENIQAPSARQRIFNIFPPLNGEGRYVELIIEGKEVR